MDYCHMICHVLWNFHVISNNFVTVSISQTGVRIHAMTSSVACDVLVTCFNDVILRHLPLYDWPVPTLGTWNQSFGFFPEWIFLPKWNFSKIVFPKHGKSLPRCVTDWNPKISKVYHIKIQPAWKNAISHSPNDSTYQKLEPNSYSDWSKNWVFSHSWYWLINSKGLKIISVCHMSYPSFFILMTS